MPTIDDQRYLKTEQYRDSENLNRRIQIHQRFSTNRQGWPAWLFERLELAGTGRIVDLGCGPGDLWLENQARIPAGVKILLADLSHGMTREARRRLVGDARFGFADLDIQATPFAEGAFERVIANHMLYHVPDIDRAVTEMARLLRPGGLAVAATNGENTMAELFDLVREVAPGYRRPVAATQRFSLRNGPTYFERYFSQVRVVRYEDALWVTEVNPLVDYLFSSATLANGLGENEREALVELFGRRIARDGGIAIRKEGGVILARK
jgi:ubiquinone/menaquinone biosynthesis C-methylase UbiE